MGKLLSKQERLKIHSKSRDIWESYDYPDPDKPWPGDFGDEDRQEFLRLDALLDADFEGRCRRQAKRKAKRLAAGQEWATNGRPEDRQKLAELKERFGNLLPEVDIDENDW